MNYALGLFLILSVFLPVPAQYAVKLEVSATDDELEQGFRTAITAELQKIPDIRLGDKGKYGLLVQMIRRPGADPAGDIFVSAVSTSESVCILEQEASGRVVSRQSCREFLTAKTYIGRLDEGEELAAEIVASFNDYVLQPLRDIEEP